jgi:hypothetical protein
MSKTALDWVMASVPAFLAVASYAGFISGHALGVALGIVAGALCVIALFAIRPAGRGSR